MNEKDQKILDTLEACGGHRGRTAEALGISRRGLFNQLRRLGVNPQLPYKLSKPCRVCGSIDKKAKHTFVYCSHACGNIARKKISQAYWIARRGKRSKNNASPSDTPS